MSWDPKKRKVIVAVSDLFIQSRVIQIAQSQGIVAEVAATPVNLPNSLGEQLIILDLDSSDYDPYQVARQLKKLTSPPILFGFYPHIKADLKHRAEQAGFDYVVTNRELVPRLARLL